MVPRCKNILMFNVMQLYVVMLPISRYSYSTHRTHRSQCVSMIYEKTDLHRTCKRYLTADVKMIACNRIAMVALTHDYPLTDAILEGTSYERMPLGVAEFIAGAAGFDLVVIDSVACDVYTRELGYRISHLQPRLDPLMMPVLKRLIQV